MAYSYTARFAKCNARINQLTTRINQINNQTLVLQNILSNEIPKRNFLVSQLQYNSDRSPLRKEYVRVNRKIQDLQNKIHSNNMKVIELNSKIAMERNKCFGG